ncbi:MAG: ferredoxin [Candidatus Methanosuratincola sp.]
MAKVPRVDRDLCIGCGNCTLVCPDVFKLDQEGKSRVINAAEKCDVDYAVSSCPVGAISLV